MVMSAILGDLYYSFKWSTKTCFTVIVLHQLSIRVLAPGEGATVLLFLTKEICFQVLICISFQLKQLCCPQIHDFFLNLLKKR